ncbi:hypothetical protein [Methylocystis sp. ATCC 49242]|uniref:hypothetical protein n=1 Tax=Methylocystis sp. ATCC 49242 TaxID=622637 RepID=UPI003527ADEC
MMDKLALARALHVVAVVIWIGGVAFVTTVLLPATRRLKEPGQRLAFFDAVERRFAWQARLTTLLAGASGFYMVAELDLWDRFRFSAFWWMHGMVAIWAVFTVMLFVAEPLFLHRWFNARATVDPEGTFALVERLHRFLLTISLIVVLGAVAGAHGGAFFG